MCRHYCDASYCDQGVFYPQECKPDEYGVAPPCAVLLAEYPGILSIVLLIQSLLLCNFFLCVYTDYMSFLVKQIPMHKMRVKVIWLGPNADYLVRKFVDDVPRRKAGRSIMFFAWRPSTITEGGKFLSLSFPQCETLSVTPDNGITPH